MLWQVHDSELLALVGFSELPYKIHQRPSTNGLRVAVLFNGTCKYVTNLVAAST